MQTTNQGIDLSVAILMDDLACAKDIANALRQQNILAHHYQGLDEFWVASSIQTPDLSIIDVTKMSKGSVQFKNHPKVVGKTMSYAFFSKDSTKILLQSTTGLSPIGFLHHDASLNAQVSGLVKLKLNEIRALKEKTELETRIQRLQSRSQRLISERSGAEEFQAHFEFIRNFCAEIETEASKQDFTHSLVNKFEKWGAIEGYGIYILNQNGQKLVSPELNRKKFHPFPALWLGQVNEQGIETFAEEMAAQVANDLFETPPITLRIHSGATHPEILIYVSFKEERMMNFPWDVFETILSSSYRKLKLYQQLPHYSSQFIPMWEALDNMDKTQKAGVDSDIRIIALSLIPLIDVAKRRTNNKFYWSSFFNDFFLQLSGRIQKTTSLSLFGPWHVIFFIPKEDVEVETQMLQSYVKQFGYWKFFEDNSQILSEDMLPSLKLIPPSSSHYLRMFDKEFSDLNDKDEDKRLMMMSKMDMKRLSN